MMKGISGKETPYKQNDFSDLLRHHVNVCSKVINRHSWASQFYQYFDMFGGPGLILDNGKTIEGSPVIFSKVIREFPILYRANIVEQDKAIFAQLKATVQNQHIKLHYGNSGEIYKSLLISNSKQFGLLYLDPDMSEDGFDLSFKIARDFALCYPRLDILLYVSANNIKRIAGAKDTPCLVDRLRPIQKTDWVIRTLRDKFQYTFLIGTNYSKPFTWGSRGFFDARSPQGQAILERANYTDKQIKKKHQPPLPHLTGLMQSTSDIPYLELSEQKRFGGLGGYVKDAIKGQLRKFIT